MKKIRNFFSHVTTFIMELFFPPRCVICNNVYGKNFFTEKVYICESCRKKITIINDSDSLCKKCSRPISSEDILCIGCQTVTHNFDVGFSCVIYEGEMRRSLLSYKFSNAHYKYRVFAQMMVDKIKSSDHFPYFDIILSVPLSKNRLKKRGFDHVNPLAKYISRHTNIKYEEKAITKTKESPPQSKLTFKERQQSVKGAFKINPKVDLSGKSVLLIDDIYTTGSTVDEISKLLRKNGANYIIVLTLCITPDIER